VPYASVVNGGEWVYRIAVITVTLRARASGRGDGTRSGAFSL